jgi:exosortase E/protease (VPEID-CTERM system)
VELILRPLVSGFTSEPSSLTIGTTRFAVSISPSCSGLEGAALMLVFGMGWLACFRRDYRFPHALVLLPAGVSAVWVLNCFRIAGLILIGNAGAAEIALGGFHSQAGWIGFNAVAVTGAVASSRVGWFNRRRERRPAERNPVSPYLAPFLAILTASMLSGAMSAGSFEHYYVLRLPAAALALWWFRREYDIESWRPGWRAVASGAVVFLLWIGAERFWPAAGGLAIATNLASMDTAARAGWLITRALAAVITVPVAEELAFRGFLLRRLESSDFEAADPRRVRWPALVISSLIFGVLHGGLWVAGTAAGAVYAWTYRRRGRLADAVAAHATTNALLAIWVVARGQWGLW